MWIGANNDVTGIYYYESQTVAPTGLRIRVIRLFLVREQLSQQIYKVRSKYYLYTNARRYHISDYCANLFRRRNFWSENHGDSD